MTPRAWRGRSRSPGTPDGKQIVVANFRSNNVSIVDVDMALSKKPGAEVARIPLVRSDKVLTALDGIGIDLYLLHAPDPRVPWLTSVRALARLLEDGLVPRVGVSNVSRDQLDAAMSVVPVRRGGGCP